MNTGSNSKFIAKLVHASSHWKRYVTVQRNDSYGNNYFATMPPVIRAGLYKVLVLVEDAWNEVKGSVASCTQQSFEFTVNCDVNFQVDRTNNDECKLSTESSCVNTGGDWLTQTNNTESSHSKLTVKVPKGTKETPEIELSPANTTKRFKLRNESSSWIASYNVPPGRWQATYMSGRAVCKTNLLEFEVKCLEGYENKEGNCTKKASELPCEQGQIRTIERACAWLTIKAAVQSNELTTTIMKPNPYLVGLSSMKKANTSATVEVIPGANYHVNFRPPKLEQSLPWVNVGLIDPAGEHSPQTVNLELDATGKSDGTKLNAKLTVDGQVQESSTSSNTIRLSAQVESTPSLVKSIFEMAERTTEGRKENMLITAIDDEGLPITDARGRYLEMTWQYAGGQKKTQNSRFEKGRFVFDLASSDLSDSGKVSVWISKVFGRETLDIAGLHRTVMPINKGLPTKGWPRVLLVESGTTKKIIAFVLAGVGVLGLLVAGMAHACMHACKPSKELKEWPQELLYACNFVRYETLFS